MTFLINKTQINQFQQIRQTLSVREYFELGKNRKMATIQIRTAMLSERKLGYIFKLLRDLSYYSDVDPHSILCGYGSRYKA